MKKSTILLLYWIIVCILLYITENIFHPNYFIQMFQKILSFIIIPIILAKYFWFKIWKIKKLDFKYWLWLWFLSVFIISISYYFLGNLISWSDISESLTIRGVTSNTFIFIFLYIMFWNSLIEEYFFRWIIFNLFQKSHNFFAYLISSLMFALYHFAIFWAWFQWIILILAVFGLFIWWLFFAWLYEKTKWIWAAWIFHICADSIILVIWYIELFS